MEWSRSETIGLSLHSCAKCNGLGTTLDRSGETQACKCALRSIFRICYNRFRHCVDQDPHISHTSIEPSLAGQKRPTTWGRKNEEYIADFEMVTRRTLDDEEHRLFRYHFYLGADWRMCCKRMNVDRGSFFHTIYRIEEKLGKVFREIRPYAIVGAFVISAVLTPPDITSQILLAVPMCLLYEFGLLLARFVVKPEELESDPLAS